MIIALIILLVLCIIFFFKAQQRQEENKEIIQKNKQAELMQVQLTTNINKLKEEEKYIQSQLENYQNNFNTTVQQQQQMYELALQEYEKNIDDKKQKIENDFNDYCEDIQIQRDEILSSLEELKSTRAAAHQALLKEQEVKDNKDNYRLLPTEADLADIRRLEIVKRELNKPRVLSMLIWQTYFQPIAKKQFPIILQAKTKCGIYKITNIQTDECYIGQSVDIYRRFCDHCKCGLGIDTPVGNKLYKAIKEYGLENFTFEILTECEPSELNEKEKYFIELYQADSFGFNSQSGNK